MASRATTPGPWSACRRAWRRSHPRDSIVRKLYALIAQANQKLGRAEAARAAVAEGRAHYPDDAELLFLDGVLRREAGDLAGAEAAFRQLMAGGREGNHFASVDDSLRGIKARHNLAVVCLETGRVGEAVAEWRAVTAADPGFVPAWVGLGEATLRARNRPAFEQVLAALEKRSPFEANALRDRWTATQT